MQIRVLGSAAGGGSPQWNCACPICEQVRAGAVGTRHRTQSSIAVRADAASPWLLINASPDVHRQLELLRTPRAEGEPIRSSPVGAVALTDAEFDHASGLLLMRESTEPLHVLAAQPVRDALTSEYPIASLLDRWCGVAWQELVPDGGARVEVLGLEIEAFTSGEDAPRYQDGADGPGASVGLTLRAGGATVTYSPTVERWDDSLRTRLAASDLVLVDGTFWSNDELASHGAGTRTARDMGHVPVGGAGGTAEQLAALGSGTRCVLIHINNSNPMLLEHGSERKTLEAVGIAVAFDGMELEL
ncbi:MAG: pyrroloquinoline quinone biosynthesis protein PqqB [Thermoleophilia bacterium]|nr:pyrroloquinoline quinone biosynthesis protein PqqB [Thermoleophilia bacterium]